MPESWRQSKVRSDTDVHIDPYFLWAEATDFTYLFGTANREKRFPVFIRVRDPFTAKQLADKRWGDWLRIPDIYAAPPLGLLENQFCTASVTNEFFDELREKDSPLSKIVWRVSLGLPRAARPAWNPPPKRVPPGGGAGKRRQALDRLIESLRQVFPFLKRKKPTPVQPPPVQLPRKVITAIIDDGLAFANERFRLADGTTRVEYVWNQDGPLYPPPGFGYGLESQKGDTSLLDGIDTNIALCSRTGLLDEDQFYQRMGHLSFAQPGHKPIAWRSAHGTHVMDIAVGHPRASAPTERPIMCVQLPGAVTADTSGGTLFSYVNDAIFYILARAGTTPVVVNLSYGNTAGPHDGSSDFEVAIDAYIQAREAVNAPLAVVLPSGNFRLQRGHAQLNLRKGDEKRLKWRILPDDATPSHVEIWLPPWSGSGPKPAVEVKLTPPGGPESPLPLKEGDPSWEWAPNGQVLCQMTYVNASLTGHRGMILISVVATATHDPNVQVAPFGTWRISLKNVGESRIDDIRAWVRRDDTPYGYPRRGRQSRFDHSTYRRFDERTGREIEEDPPGAHRIRRDGTISALATGTRTVVVTGMRRDRWRPSKYSAGGPVVKPPGRGTPLPNGPDVTAVSNDSTSLYNGLLASGSRSSSIVAFNGTSVAAPQITRWIAEQMAHPGGKYDRVAVAKFARFGTPSSPWTKTRTEVNPPPDAPPPPWAPGGLSALRIGGGRVEFVAGDFPSIVDRQVEQS